MKFLLIGCNGKMGKTIINLAREYDDIIVCGIDTKDLNLNFKTYLSTEEVKEDFDAIIDFSTTENHVKYINLALARNVPYGLFSTLANQETKSHLKKAGQFIPILFCKNESFGVNILYELINICANNINDCDAIIQEYHHKQKLDKPSGTAREIERILDDNDIKYETHSFRVGKEQGTHTIQFFLQDETITLTHTALSRDVFARGAIIAMHNLKEKENGLYFKPPKTT